MPRTRRPGQASSSGRPSRSTRPLHPELRGHRTTPLAEQRTRTQPGPVMLARGALSVLESAA
eukprot:5583405-Pyramimonas_sp.AAC.1